MQTQAISTSAINDEANPQKHLPDLCLARIFLCLHSKQDWMSAALTCCRWRSLLPRVVRARLRVQHKLSKNSRSSKEDKSLTALAYAYFEAGSAAFDEDSFADYDDVFENFFYEDSFNLEVRSWRGLTEQVLQALSTFPRATSVIIQGLTPVPNPQDSDSILMMSAMDVKLFQLPQPQNLARLTRLTLKNMYIFMPGKNDWVSAIVLACPALTHIHLQCIYHPVITDSNLADLAMGLPLLRAVSLSNYKFLPMSVTDDGIDTLLDNCRCMAHLALCYEDLTSGDNIKGWGVRHGIALRSLTIQGCCKLSYSDLEVGLRSGIGGALRHLDLRSCSLTKAADNSRLPTLIAQHCSGLEVLRLPYVQKMTEELILRNIRQETFPRLRSLELRSAMHLVPSGAHFWENLVTSLPMLQALQIAPGGNVHEEDLHAIANACPALRMLSICSSEKQFAKKVIEGFKKAHPTVQLKHFNTLLMGDGSSDDDSDAD